MNIPLLRALQTQPDSYFWPDSLARLLGKPLARLMCDLRELESFGFGFDHIPNRGVRYAEPARRLCAEQIEWELGTRRIGRRVAVWQRVTSTNDVVARAAKSRSNDGLVVLAEEQTAGRGRRHRRWHAPPQSSILMSVLLFPPPPVRSIALLTSLAAVSVADVIGESLGLPARIKWPNDVRVAGRKCCGILVEVLARGRRRSTTATTNDTTSAPLPALNASRDPPAWRAAVIGIGINVNLEQSEFPRDLDSPAASLKELCGRRLDRSDLARSVLQQLDQYYELALAGKFSVVWDRWRELADLIGQPVRVERTGGMLRGSLVDLRPERSVTIRKTDGEVVELPADGVLSIADATTE